MGKAVEIDTALPPEFMDEEIPPDAEHPVNYRKAFK